MWPSKRGLPAACSLMVSHQALVRRVARELATCGCQMLCSALGQAGSQVASFGADTAGEDFLQGLRHKFGTPAAPSPLEPARSRPATAEKCSALVRNSLGPDGPVSSGHWDNWQRGEGGGGGRDTSAETVSLDQLSLSIACCALESLHKSF